MPEFGNQYANEGWGETEKEREQTKDFTDNFGLKDGESADIRTIGKVPIEIATHWKAHPENGRLVCLKTFDNQAQCPVCDYVNSTGNEKFIQDAKAKNRNYILVFDYRDKKVKLWGFSYDVRKTLRSILNNRPDIGASPNKLDDFVLRVSRKGSGISDTEYTMLISQQAVPLTPEEQEIIKSAKSLEEQFKPKTFEELQQLFSFRKSATQPQGIAGNVSAFPSTIGNTHNGDAFKASKSLVPTTYPLQGTFESRQEFF